MTRPPPPTRALLALILGIIAIGFSPILVKLSSIGPVATGFWRTALAIPILWLWNGSLTLYPTNEISKKAYYYALLAGLFFAGDLAIWHWSLRFTSVTNATLLVNLAPILLCFSGWLWLQEPIGLRFLLGLTLAIVGTLCVAQESLLHSSFSLWGDSLSLIAAFFLAGYLFWTKKAQTFLATPTTAVISTSISSLTLYCLALATEPTVLPTDWRDWGVLVLLAGLPQAIGQTAITYALAKLPVSLSSIFLLLQPVTAALLAWPILGEVITLPQAIGGVIILAGIHFARNPS